MYSPLGSTVEYHPSPGGFVHADAYDGYNVIHNNLRHLGCWMHARRYFVEAEPSDPRAVEALAFIRTLYAVEREIKDKRD